MPNLKVEFIGLCAHLFNKQGTSDMVLLVRNDMHAHEPELLITLGDLTDEADERWFKRVGVGLGLLDLSGYHTVIKPDGQDSGALSLNPNDLKGKKQGCPQSTNNGDVSWLVDLNDLTGKPSRGDLTAANPPSAVAARVLLAEGDLDCIGHAAEVGTVRRYKFDAKPERAIADTIRCRLKGRESALLELKPIRSGRPSFSFSLRLPADILVSNSAATGTGGSLPHHFAAFYALLDPPPVPEPSMSPGGKCGGTEGLTFDPKSRPCPQAMLYVS